jgi:hypothetical protein
VHFDTINSHGKGWRVIMAPKSESSTHDVMTPRHG